MLKFLQSYFRSSREMMLVAGSLTFALIVSGWLLYQHYQDKKRVQQIAHIDQIIDQHPTV